MRLVTARMTVPLQRRAPGSECSLRDALVDPSHAPHPQRWPMHRRRFTDARPGGHQFTTTSSPVLRWRRGMDLRVINGLAA